MPEGEERKSVDARVRVWRAGEDRITLASSGTDRSEVGIKPITVRKGSPDYDKLDGFLRANGL